MHLVCLWPVMGMGRNGLVFFELVNARALRLLSRFAGFDY